MSPQSHFDLIYKILQGGFLLQANGKKASVVRQGAWYHQNINQMNSEESEVCSWKAANGLNIISEFVKKCQVFRARNLLDICTIECMSDQVDKKVNECFKTIVKVEADFPNLDIEFNTAWYDMCFSAG